MADRTDRPMHATLGVNAHRTFCPHCKKDSGQVRMMGGHNTVATCKCGAVVYGPSEGQECPNRRCDIIFSRKTPGVTVRLLGENEPVPGPFCDDCRPLAEAAKARVQAGGVYVYCLNCGETYASSPEWPVAKFVRERTGVTPPEPCGTEIRTCPKCFPGKRDTDS
jgi:RNase P subunit RPR2